MKLVEIFYLIKDHHYNYLHLHLNIISKCIYNIYGF